MPGPGSPVPCPPLRAHAGTLPAMRYAPRVTRDRSLLGECAELKRALEGHADLDSLRAAPDWPQLRTRLDALLSTVRRHRPAEPPRPAEDPGIVRAVHWNIEHGNWYDQVEYALLTQPQLADADLLMFNEIDLGMARAGNRDVTADLSKALGRYGVWAPLFLETTLGRDDDPRMAGERANEEGLFGLAILSRWPISDVRVIDLPSPEDIQFEAERMYGRHVALMASIEHPAQPFIAVSAHLEVHRTRADRATQMRVLLDAVARETRPVILAGDFNSHTFDRGRWWDPLLGGMVLLAWPSSTLRRRLLYPDQGPAREPLFDALREHDFEWQRFMDRVPTLNLRFERLDEAKGLLGVLGPILRWAERRGTLRLDWFAGRGWSDGRGATVHGLDGPGHASDHAPIVAVFRRHGRPSLA